PIDPNRTGCCGGTRTGPPNDVEITQPAERTRRGQLGKARDLLAGPALEIGGDEEWPPRATHQLSRQRQHRVGPAAEQYEPADTKRERARDGRGFVCEAPVGIGSEGGEYQSCGISHAGATIPSTRGPAAPVAATRLPG